MSLYDLNKLPDVNQADCNHLEEIQVTFYCPINL